VLRGEAAGSVCDSFYFLNNFAGASGGIADNLSLPKTDNLPTLFSQFTIYQSIPGAVSLDLWKPILLVRFVFLATPIAPSIAMPELTVAKDSDSATDENKVRFTKDRILLPVA
jgi:hypothetical protein